MNRRTIILLHIAIWAMLFLSPLTFLRRDETFHLVKYLVMCVSPLTLMIVFYCNYLWLVPKYFFRPGHHKFLLINTVMVVCLGVLVHYWLSFAHSLFESPEQVHHDLTVMETLVFIIRDCFNLAVAATVAASLVLATRVHHSEEARLEAEAARADAELRNLRSQINPHFLLNTLNNIYALTAIDPGRAQDAVQQLSKMLRHMLYDNQETFVNISDEIQFLENYVSLMKLRLPQTVDVQFTTDVSRPDLKIAPLVFISLIENAFKHGVSPTMPSFIHISVKADDATVVCGIENSNHPKTESDRSGHGIGLQQVQRRLDLAYPGRYEWLHGASADGKVYHSTIKILSTTTN